MKVHHQRLRSPQGGRVVVTTTHEPCSLGTTSGDLADALRLNDDEDAVWKHAERANVRDLEHIIESGEVWSPRDERFMPLDELVRREEEER